MHQLSLPEDPERWGVDPSYSMTHSAEAMAKVKGIGRGKKYNLMAQVIPIYGFGILLYIFYIIYKVITVTDLHGRQVLWIYNTTHTLHSTVYEYKMLSYSFTLC